MRKLQNSTLNTQFTVKSLILIEPYYQVLRYWSSTTRGIHLGGSWNSNSIFTGGKSHMSFRFRHNYSHRRKLTCVWNVDLLHVNLFTQIEFKPRKSSILWVTLYLPPLLVVAGIPSGVCDRWSIFVFSVLIISMHTPKCCISAGTLGSGNPSQNALIVWCSINIDCSPGTIIFDLRHNSRTTRDELWATS